MTTTPDDVRATTPSRERLLTAVRDSAEALTAWVDLRRRQLRVPGVQVCIRVGEGIGVSAAFGSADVENDVPLTTRHLFRVASHSKTFTATAAMQLREDGVLGLDDRVARWVPELADHALGSVTVRELLGHQAGIVRDGEDADFWQHLGDFPTVEELLARLPGEGRVLEPNTHFKYTNVGYSLLGIVVARAAGSSYEEAVRSRILDPLGLSRVHVDIDDVPTEECAWGHSGLFGRDEDEPPFVLANPSTFGMAPATGFVACAEDLSAYAAAHALGDDRLLTDASKRLMQRDESILVVDGKEQGRYGLGLILDEIGGRRIVGHSGGFPGFITRTLVDPVTGLVVCVLTNQTGGPAAELATGLLKLIDLAAREAMPTDDEAAARSLPAGAPLGSAPQDAAAAGIDPESFTGRFVCSWGYLDIRMLGDRLVAYSPDSPDPTFEHQDLRIVDADTLTARPQDGFGAPGELWHVARDDAGAPVAVRSGGVTQWREEEFFARYRQDAARR
ncbi:serine hydrolase domain-containing protein [Mobilicoccus pelagius]|uniref:Putative beta-lactamase n=1 Tax=Mobilicoccus pelagius NBRC 104925 TaxID=1089455 RepID=H5UP25_9MICO|nr:serine hydrolase domain-containing protein [Mobilicoccus pelagius]GAB47483.1 putative beta-lactamase [Mobilicoccus pelagius NBRC 104925]